MTGVGIELSQPQAGQLKNRFPLVNDCSRVLHQLHWKLFWLERHYQREHIKWRISSEKGKSIAIVLCYFRVILFTTMERVEGAHMGNGHLSSATEKANGSGNGHIPSPNGQLSPSNGHLGSQAGASASLSPSPTHSSMSPSRSRR